MLSTAGLVRLIHKVYPADVPQQLLKLIAAYDVQRGGDIPSLARGARTTPTWLRKAAGSSDVVRAALGISVADLTEEQSTRARAMLGQLLLGALAERAFEVIYREELGTDDLKLLDDRKGRSETDYRVLNGSDRQVFRLNIKFHGSQFNKAQDMVGLDPADCFALATYKIHQAVELERKEVLPYVFAVVSVLGLTSSVAGEAFDNEVVQFAALIANSKVQGKRRIEDDLVEVAVAADTEQVQGFAAQIKRAPWRLISATRANTLLRDQLFDRVYAVRVRAFSRNYRNAEVDMHFSLSQDLTPLSNFFESVRQRGLHGATALLTAGRI